jgi:hypothetical protein
VIERKYLDMFAQLKREQARKDIEPLPGWFARRARNLRPSQDVVERIPRGPAVRTSELDPRSSDSSRRSA